MITTRFDNKLFKKQMNNLIDYSVGFLDGMQNGKRKFLVSLGSDVSELASQFIDSNARVNPEALHHVYEWYQTGSPNARLFDIEYVANKNGISFISSFKQSSTVKSGSTEPFREKAFIMENGISVTIKPKNGEVLRFEDNGDVVYTKKQVTVDNPGGITQNQFKNTFESFFKNYFTQAFLKSSGLREYFARPKSYKANLSAGIKGGRSVGLSAGYKWVAEAGVMR
jgi:hypothetical protein